MLLSSNFFTSQNIYIVSRTLSTVFRQTSTKTYDCVALEGPSNPIGHRCHFHLHCSALSIVRSERRVCVLFARRSGRSVIRYAYQGQTSDQDTLPLMAELGEEKRVKVLGKVSLCEYLTVRLLPVKVRW